MLLTLNKLLRITQTTCLLRVPLGSWSLAVCLRAEAGWKETGRFNKLVARAGLRPFKGRKCSWPCLPLSRFIFSLLIAAIILSLSIDYHGGYTRWLRYDNGWHLYFKLLCCFGWVLKTFTQRLELKLSLIHERWDFGGPVNIKSTKQNCPNDTESYLHL